MSATVFRDYKVHHSSADGVLVQLPGDGGFGRLTRDSLGGDALADRLLKSFSAREFVPGILCRTRDAQGYRLLTVMLSEAWSALLTYPVPVRHLVSQLLRKHLLAGLGTTTAGRVLRSTGKGTVLSLGPGTMAVAAYEQLAEAGGAGSAKAGTAAGKQRPGSGSSRTESDGDDSEDEPPSAPDLFGRGNASGANAVVEVRLLNYDTDANVLNVTANSEVVENTPLDTSVAAAVLGSLCTGDTVEARVLLSTTDDGCAVVEVPSFCPATGEPCSVLGYYIYDWAAAMSTAAAAAAAKRAALSSAARGRGKPSAPSRSTPTAPAVAPAPAAKKVPPVVGSKCRLTVEFVPDTSALLDAIPFLVLSQRTDFLTLPGVRAVPAQRADESLGDLASPLARAASGLVGLLPWRGDACESFSAGAHGDVDAEGYSTHGAAAGPASAEPRLRRRRLEEAIDAHERAMDSTVPTHPEEFQRLLLASPNSSYLWTQYMAHYLGLQQFEQARQVAERALETIAPRELGEQLNVWVAYLNIENLYGTAESLSAVFKRALQRQLDRYQLHERLADIFAASRKSNQLLSLCRTMTTKFRTERRAWERLGTVLADQDKRDQLKRVVKDIGAALKKDEAALVIVHVAIHEYKKGSPESGRSLFEGLLAKAPRRSDVWSAYVDQEIGLLTRRELAGSAAHVRSVFERAASMNFSARVTHELLARFLSFEKAHGSPTDVERVKERARAYVTAKIHAVTETGVVE